MGKDVPGTVIKLETLKKVIPAFLNQKGIMQEKGIRYNMSFFRYREAIGLNKVKIGSLIRYLPEDVKDDNALICSTPITNFENLVRRHEGDVTAAMQDIQETALEMLK